MDAPPETLAALQFGLMRTRAHAPDNPPDGQEWIIEIPLIIGQFLNGTARRGPDCGEAKAICAETRNP